ncbi:protein of unknown function [Thauera humireducens]|nr:protein of unknown function [Thauera humireducens]
MVRRRPVPPLLLQMLAILIKRVARVNATEKCSH